MNINHSNLVARVAICWNLNGFNDVNCDELISFIRDRHTKETRQRSNNHLVPEKTRLDIRKYFFTNRVVEMWNDLPCEVREASSIKNFKNRYDEYLKMYDVNV